MMVMRMVMVMCRRGSRAHTKKTIRRSSSSFLSPARSPTIPLTFPRSSSSPHSSSFPCLSSPLPLPSLLLLLIIFLILLFPLESCTSARKPKARAYNGLCLCLGFLPEVVFFWFFGFSQWFCSILKPMNSLDKINVFDVNKAKHIVKSMFSMPWYVWFFGLVWGDAFQKQQIPCVKLSKIIKHQ